MNPKNVLLFIFDGFSDWESAYATVGISKTDKYQLQTVGITNEPVISMGGLTVLPDLEVKEADLSQTAMLILPGGTGWEEESDRRSTNEGGNIIDSAQKMVGHCLANDIPVAAICGATTFLGREGWLDDIRHTSNHPEYLRTMAPEYNGSPTYRIEPAVVDENIITASGTSPISFARKIFIMLGIEKDEELKEWFRFIEKFNTETVGIE